MLNKWFNQGINWLIAIWILLSFCILVCNGFFWINDFISRPQHGLFDNFDGVSAIIQAKKQFWYRLYFVLDFFWALYLLIIIGDSVKDAKGVSLLDYKNSKTLASKIFIFFAIMAFLFDFIEGICYWMYWGEHLKLIAGVKIGMYAVCFGFLLYWLLKTFFLPHFKAILRFVWTSLFSIVFLVLIYALITMMPQGGTLIVDLFYNPWNILILFFLMAFLAIMISHYPVYSDIWTNGDNTCVTLGMDRRWRLFGFGIIYYKRINSNSASSRSFDNRAVKAMHRSLGILLYIAMFNIFFGVISRFFEVQFDVLTLTIFVLLVVLFSYYLEGKKYDDWKRKLADNSFGPKVKEETVRAIVKYVRWFPKYFVICNTLVLATAICSLWLQWSRWTIVLFLIALGCQMFMYTMFKISRTFFKYVYRSEALVKERKEMFNPKTLAVFQQYDPNTSRGEGGLGKFIGMLSHNVRYLRLMQLSGVTSLIALILANSFFAVATFFNPLVIILLYIIFFYSLYVIIFKHVLYYHRLKDCIYSCRNFFKYGIPLILCLLFGWIIYSSQISNDLHQLSLVERENQKPLSYDAFLKSMTSGNNTGRPQNYFLIGSYGGGLKANLWNLLLLNKLEKDSKKEFFNRTLVMSGVSGGAVGLGNFSSLLYEQEDSSVIDKRILKIGKSNVLSNELTYLIGRDMIREFLPFFSHDGRDRSYKSMERHAHYTGMDKYNTYGFDDYWRKVYKSRKDKFPALIINTTAVGGQQGVASSVKFPDNTFAGARTITDFNGDYKNKTLTYFGAISTTNRFPFFSPTAKVPNKGSYLDGGYFDNSGMLSALEVYDAVTSDKTKRYASRINPVFINIINSEDFYISEKTREFGLKPKNINDASEIGSIIGTVTSIDKFPRFVLEKIRARGFAVELIMMPHKLSYEKIKSSLSGEVRKPLELMEKIKLHNDSIDQALRAYKPYRLNKWGVVQPPLARILSTPAVHYQEAMISKHPSVYMALQRILDDYITAEEVIDTQFQERVKRRNFSRNSTDKSNLNVKEKRNFIKDTLER